MEDIRKLLKEYRRLKAEIKAIELDIEEFHDKDNIGPVGVNYSERSGQTYKFNSATENEAVTIADKTTQLEREKRVKEREIERIDNALSVLDENEKEVLELKYIKGCGWRNVTYKLDREYSTVKAIEIQALKKIEPFLKQ